MCFPLFSSFGVFSSELLDVFCLFCFVFFQIPFKNHLITFLEFD